MTNRVLVPFYMPQLAESLTEATISRWLKQEGDAVRAFEPLFEVSTDKVDTEIPAPFNGTLTRICVPAGETIAIGALVAELTAAESSAAQSEKEPFTSPVVARLAAEQGLDLRQISGSGRGGRVTKKDVEAWLQAQRGAAQPPSTPAPADPAGEWLPLTPLRRAIADHMTRSAQSAPHVTTVFEVDFSAVLKRQAQPSAAARPTLTAYVALAAVAALQQHPLLNAEWRGEGLWLHRPVHLGVAVAVTGGLLVPVLRDAQTLDLPQLAAALADRVARARAGQLRAGETSGGTFTLTNHGTGGSLFATPIIHHPQAAILGVGALQKRVCVVDDMLAIRPLAYLTLTFDHRVLDGAAADAFLQTVKTLLETTH